MGVARATGGKSSYKYAHKLYEPRAQLSAISREELLQRIFGPEPARAVLVQGPAGHGKSTLLQQAMVECRARGMVAGWFTADEADNDLRRLAMHLQALLVGMEETLPGMTATDSRTLLDEQGSRADGFIARLLELPQPVALFFDDFHALANRSVLAFFKGLLDRLPEHVRVFIGSRSVPDIGLARLVVNNLALVLRAEELRFSPQEVRRFFASAQDLAIREDELEAIYRKTEGWPAALQLFRLSLASPNVRRSLTDLGAHRPRELADYLADNVLALQPPEVQEFLLRSSPLTRLSAPLCDEVLGRSDSQTILLRLERSGLFVRSLDSERGWFGYHALFANFLEEQLREEDPALLRRIHGKAAAWFKKHAAHEEAIQHAVAAADYRLAADVLEAWSARLIAFGHLVTVERWYEALPLDEVGKRPGLVVKVAWALCFLRRHQKLRPILALLHKLRGKPAGETQPDVVRSMLAILDDDIAGSRDIIHGVEVHGQDASDFRAFELGAACNLYGFLAIAEGELERAREYLALARTYGDTADSGFSLGYSISTFCVNLMSQGLLPEALERLRQAAALPWMRLDDSVASAVMAACHVQALYEAGELDAAEAVFDQSHESIARFALLDYAAVAFVSMSRIHELRGRPAQALETLDQADSVGHTSLWPRLVRIVGWERVRRFVLRGEFDRAQAAASRIAPGDASVPEGWIPFSEDAEGEAVGRARLSLHVGQPDEALRLIAEEMVQAQRQGRVRRQIRLFVLEALALARRGSDNAAQRSLLRALVLARPGGYQRSILDEGAAVLPLLRRVYEVQSTVPEPGTQELQQFIGRLLDAAGERPGVGRSQDFQALEPLTEREKKILVLLANGVSNEEIASRMFVSRNTIKFHLKNIYSKLAVNSRLQAINAARAMGLIR